MDESGAAIPGAKVRAVQRSTNQAIESETNQNGYYTLPYLQPSSYDIEVTATGFQRLRRENVTLMVAEKLDLPLQARSRAGDAGDHRHGGSARAGADRRRLRRPQLRLRDDLRIRAQRPPGLHADGPHPGRALHAGGVRLHRLLRHARLGRERQLRHERRQGGHQQLQPQRRAHQPDRLLSGGPQRGRHPGIQGHDEHLRRLARPHRRRQRQHHPEVRIQPVARHAVRLHAQSHPGRQPHAAQRASERRAASASRTSSAAPSAAPSARTRISSSSASKASASACRSPWWPTFRRWTCATGRTSRSTT